MNRDQEETSIIEVKSPGKCFLRVSSEAVLRRQPRLYLELAPELASVRVSRAWRSHGEQVASWLCERPRATIGEGVASGTVEGPALKGSHRAAEAWCREESPERLFVKVQPSCSKSPQHFGDASIRERPPKTVPWWCPENKPCVRQKAEPEKWPSPAEEPRGSWMDPGY